jgi:hypothetical protein
MIIKNKQYDQLTQYELIKYYDRLEQYLTINLPEKVIIIGKKKLRNEIIKTVDIGKKFGFVIEADNAFFSYFFFLLVNEQENIITDLILSDTQLSSDEKFNHIKNRYLGL